MLDILCVGTALVDSILRGFDPNPVSVSGYRAESGTLCVGGEAVNEALAAAKLGARTGIFCRLGTDAAGELVHSALQDGGVDCSRALRSEQPTPVTTMFVRPDGGRQSVTNLAHRFNFHPEQYPERLLDTRALLLGSLFRAPFDDPEIIHAVLKTASAHGIPVFADTKIPNFRFLKLTDIAQSLPMIDYLTPNEDEARYYSGREQIEDMAQVFLDAGVKNVVIKLGAEGCYFRNAHFSIRIPAIPITAVDSTGAGDTFLAGFASELLRGAETEEALRFANACGAVCTTAVGAATALQSREQVLELLRAQG